MSLNLQVPEASHFYKYPASATLVVHNPSAGAGKHGGLASALKPGDNPPDADGKAGITASAMTPKAGTADDSVEATSLKESRRSSLIRVPLIRTFPKEQPPTSAPPVTVTPHMRSAAEKGTPVASPLIWTSFDLIASNSSNTFQSRQSYDSLTPLHPVVYQREQHVPRPPSYPKQFRRHRASIESSPQDNGSGGEKRRSLSIETRDRFEELIRQWALQSGATFVGDTAWSSDLQAMLDRGEITVQQVNIKDVVTNIENGVSILQNESSTSSILHPSDGGETSSQILPAIVAPVTPIRTHIPETQRQSEPRTNLFIGNSIEPKKKSSHLLLNDSSNERKRRKSDAAFSVGSEASATKLIFPPLATPLGEEIGGIDGISLGAHTVGTNSSQNVNKL